MKTNEPIIPSHNSHFQVTAIASAATEIDLLKKIISDLALDSGRAYLVFESLSTPQTHNLVDELTSHTKIPVVEIVHHVDIQPNHIYIVPEDNFLIREDEILKLQPKIRSSKTNNSFDSYFEAVGQTYKSYAVGVILSWFPLDGATGLKKLKEAGGATIAALSKRGIIQNAVTSEYIDYFTAPHEIEDKLLQIHETNLVTHSYEEKEESTPSEQELLDEITSILFLKTGTDFQHYKYTTLRRRVAKRMVDTRQETIEKYLVFLRNNNKEQDLLFDDFLISVTYFFRDQDAFDNLFKTVIPFLIKNAINNTIRIWSAGCSTGEEAYSLAICLDEYLEEINRKDIKVQIIASDLSEKCISKARMATYTLQDVKNISEKRLEKYFTKKENSFHVNKIIRDMCVFAVHDLTKDAPFSKIDFVSCRNVLIYFDTDLQNQVLALFNYALRENGYLFLGKSEWAHSVSHLFAAVDKLDKIYTRKTIVPLQSKKIFYRDDNTKLKQNTEIENDYIKITSDILLEHLSPAAVLLINEDLEIVHFHGDTSQFLQQAPGKPSFNILHMVREEIAFELKNYITKARNEKKNFSGEFIAVKNQPQLTSFEIIYLSAHSELLLIIFYKKTIPALDSYHNNAQNTEKELLQLRDDFKRVTEEQLIYFEELQTTNEELVSTNEELQMINLQLENSTHELQSNSQELSCVNDELRDYRQELTSVRNFYESIINTIKQPLVIIDKNFIIRNANPSFYNYFKTTEEQTEGFSILDIGNSNWNNPLFIESVLKKVSRNEIAENFKMQFNFDNSNKKTMLITASLLPDSTANGKILIALEDITDLEKSLESINSKNQELQLYTEMLESFTNSASDSLLEPIRRIYMFGKKLLDAEKDLTESGKHNLNRLLSSAVNMNQLIEDLIEYSKINFTRKELKKTDLNVLLKKTIISLKNTIRQHKATIEIDALPTLLIIPSQMMQLFTHLISNAIKYAKQNDIPKIKIGFEETDSDEIIDFGAAPENQYVKIFISDNGIGFHKNFETLIFNPFYKLPNDDKEYGSGLGLTLVQKIVYNHKGFVKVDSEPNKGTTVFIYLPLLH
ncbi:CheR family methyltransferase [Flavobacterium artemisiae]|uniref:histidine kinase n=1 Tax=Flavobacterium artemisiae TaxID=2126556 RepID=A0ABW4HJ94_9FLAO